MQRLRINYRPSRRRILYYKTLKNSMSKTRNIKYFKNKTITTSRQYLDSLLIDRLSLYRPLINYRLYTWSSKTVTRNSPAKIGGDTVRRQPLYTDRVERLRILWQCRRVKRKQQNVCACYESCRNETAKDFAGGKDGSDQTGDPVRSSRRTDVRNTCLL